MRYLTRTTPLCVFFLALTINVFAQCAGKTGFALQACQVQAGNIPTASGAITTIGADPKTGFLTTSFADSIHSDVLPASMEPKAFLPLTSLDRADDGSYILKTGVYEAYVEGYSLDADHHAGAGGYYPAPFAGSRAKAIETVLKQAELHPGIHQPDIQSLLTGLVAGTDLAAMPLPAQQAAAALLPPDVVAQLKGAPKAKAVKNAVIGILSKRLQQIPGMQGQPAVQNSQNYKDVPSLLSASAVPDAQTATPAIERGAWTKMPGGFYLRYLPDGFAKVRVQLMVPASVADGARVTFDPTQCIAVSGGPTSQRVGITMRSAK